MDIDKFAAEQQLDFQQYFGSELAELQLLAADKLLDLKKQHSIDPDRKIAGQKNLHGIRSLLAQPATAKILQNNIVQ